MENRRRNGGREGGRGREREGDVDVHVRTFIGGNLAYGAVPVASSRAVIPRLQISAFSL